MRENQECVVVTGASSGIGEAIAERLADEGHVVACLSRRGSTPLAADRPGCFVGIECDVSREEDRSRSVQIVRELDLPVAGLVNAAGFQLQSASADLPLSELELILDTNLVGTIRMCQLMYPLLRGHERDSLIVNIGSFYGKLGVPNFLAYCASKAGLSSVTRTLAVEWAREGIRVLDIAPGYVETGLNADFLETPGNREALTRRVPVGRLGSSDEIARLVKVLFRERIGFLTGETIYVDGGQGVRL